MTTGKKTIFYIFVLLIRGCGPVYLSLRYVKASLIWSISSAGMKLRMFLVYTESSTMRIGEAGFEQLANMVSFRALDFVPLTQFSLEKCIFLLQRDVVQNVTLICRKIEISLFYFSPNSLLTRHRINVLKKECKTSTSCLSPTLHATCVIASNSRSPEFDCITYAEGEYSISI